MAISSKMGNPLRSKTTPLSGCFLPAYLTLGALAGGTVVDVTFPRPYFASNSALMVRELYGYRCRGLVQLHSANVVIAVFFGSLRYRYHPLPARLS